MKKNIILSSVAAAALATMLTGCGGSDSTTSGGSSSTLGDVSGVITKAPVAGATVTIGGVTATTDADGAYTVKSANLTTATEITATGGYMCLDTTIEAGATCPEASREANTVELKADYNATENPSNVVSVATTLVKEFKDAGKTADEAKAAAANVLGLSTTEVFANAQDLTPAQKNIQAAIFKILSVATSTTAKSALVTTLATEADKGAVDTTAFDSVVTSLFTAVLAADTTLKTADVVALQKAVEKATNSTNIEKQEQAVIKYINEAKATIKEAIKDQNLSSVSDEDLATLVDDAVATVDVNETAYKNAINLVEDAVKLSDGGVEWEATSYSADNLENNLTFVGFNFQGLETVADDNGTNTGKLVLQLTKLNDNNTNANASYQMVLEKLNVKFNESKFLELYADANSSVEFSAKSDLGKFSTPLDANVTLLNDNNLITNYNAEDETAQMAINVGVFANYIKDALGTSYDDKTSGNFSNSEMVADGKFKSGNYSLKVYLDLGSRTLTKESGLSKLATGAISIDSTTAKKGFKVLDKNLEITPSEGGISG